MTIHEAIEKYGPVLDGKWANEGKWCSLLQVPSDLSERWINSLTGSPTRHIYCNKDFQPHLVSAFKLIQERSLQRELKSFDGCFELRDIRGEPRVASAHSYAIALDINASTNQLGAIGDISEALVNCFKEAGLVWGGDFKRLDFMHFSMGF